MAWNITLTLIEASEDQIDLIIPDIFEKVKEGMIFEDATSVSIGQGVSVGYFNGFVIIIEVAGRMVSDDKFPMQLSKQFDVLLCHISEEIVFRTYKGGEVQQNIYGREEARAWLETNKVIPKDEWGETMSWQILEFVTKITLDDLFNLKYDLYEVE